MPSLALYSQTFSTARRSRSIRTSLVCFPISSSSTVATQQPLTRLVFDFLRRFVFVFNIITTITIVVIVVNMIVGDSIITGIGIIIAAIGIIIVGGVGIVAIDGGGNRCAMP